MKNVNNMDLISKIKELALTDITAAQDLFNNNVFEFSEELYNELMDLLDK